MSLQNLENLIESCRNQYDDLPYTSDVKLDVTLASLLKSALDEVDNKTEHIITPFSIEFINGEEQRASVASSALWYGKCFWELSHQLDKYLETLTNIKNNLDYSRTEIKGFLKSLPSNEINTSDHRVAVGLRDEIENFFTNPTEKEHFKTFLSNGNWWQKTARTTEAETGKKLDRNDVKSSALALACRVIIDSSSKMLIIIKAFQHSEALRNYFSLQNFEQFELTQQPVQQTSQKAAENIIYYGAPGVGKSYEIDSLCGALNSIRTVFHPDTQYSDFAGCLKPKMDGTDVVYEFRPGPFTLALEMAAKNTGHHIHLVIEELNRAPAAAVFGELFQLLDRDNSGRSQYSITLSDPDMTNYLQTNASALLDGNNLRIPANLSIYATMNSSDQAVMPMDTAFKRRWKFKYVPINFDLCPEGIITLPITDASPLEVKWKDFASLINEILQAKQVPDDRLLGPWFLNGSELSNEQAALSSLKGKLLLYIWDDVLRHDEKDIVFASDINTYGALIKNLDEGKPIFNIAIEKRLKGFADVIDDINSPEATTTADQ